MPAQRAPAPRSAPLAVFCALLAAAAPAAAQPNQEWFVPGQGQGQGQGQGGQRPAQGRN